MGRTLLSAGLLDLGGLAVTDEPVVGLELLHRLGAVVDEGEAGALAATVLGAETEAGNLLLVGLVELGELGAELILGDVRAVGVQDVTVCRKKDQSLAQGVPSLCLPMKISLCARPARGEGLGGGGDGVVKFERAWGGLYAHDHLLAAQKRVANELARAQGHLRVRHAGWLIVVVDVVGVDVSSMGALACCFKPNVFRKASSAVRQTEKFKFVVGWTVPRIALA